MEIHVESAHIFRPKVKPENILDFLIAMSGGLIQMAFAILLPSATFYIYTEDQNLTFIIYMSMSMVWALFTVKSIRVSRYGVEFARILGNPRHLSWDQIKSARKATTKETIIDGWLWPPFPAREMTYSLSSNGHYRIQYDKGFVFFPPSEPEKFEKVMKFFYDVSRNNSKRPG